MDLVHGLHPGLTRQKNPCLTRLALARSGDVGSSRRYCAAAMSSKDGDFREQAEACLRHQSIIP
jgi:hypothetical protein